MEIVFTLIFLLLVIFWANRTGEKRSGNYLPLHAEELLNEIIDHHSREIENALLGSVKASKYRKICPACEAINPITAGVCASCGEAI
jgi:RNA polymerase-binding transcription factor DksA